MWEQPTYDKGASTTPTRNKLIHKYRKATQTQPIVSLSDNQGECGTNKKQLRKKEDVHRSAASHFFHSSPTYSNNCNSINRPSPPPPPPLSLRLPTRYHEANGAGSFWTRRSDRAPVLISKAPRLLLVEVSDGFFLAWRIFTPPLLSALNWTFSSTIARTPR